DLMKQAKVFAHTSLFEGFGNVLLEALFAGCRIVATAGEGAASEVLDNGNYGTLVPTGDHVAIANAIAMALDSAIEQQVPHHYLQKFSIDKIADQYLKLLLNVGDGDSDGG